MTYRGIKVTIRNLKSVSRDDKDTHARAAIQQPIVEITVGHLGGRIEIILDTRFPGKSTLSTPTQHK